MTQGPLPAGGTNAHPAMAYGAAMVAMGMPETMTTGLGTVGTACPPCEHSTVAPMCRIGPGIGSPSHAPAMVSAVSLMATAGPMSVIVAPCPLLM